MSFEFAPDLSSRLFLTLTAGSLLPCASSSNPFRAPLVLLAHTYFQCWVPFLLFFFFYFFNYSHTSIAAQKSPPTPGLPLTPSELMASSSTPALHIGWTSICHLYLFFLLHRFTSTGRGRGEGTEGREGSGYKGSWSKVIFLFTFASFIICSSVYYRLHSLNKKH